MKKIFKKILRFTGWDLKKILSIRNYSNEKPSLELVKTIMNCSGVLHLGAHRGGEAAIYDWFQKDVIWVEANPLIFDDLEINLKQYYNQSAYNCLITDLDNKMINFNLSSNDYASSSIFNFGDYSVGKNKIWVDRILKMIKNINLKSISIDTFVSKNNIDISKFDHWVIDIQGAELLALKGAKSSLKKCNSIYLEVSTEEVYEKAPRWKEIKYYLNENNFSECWKPESIHTSVLFKRIN